MKQILSDMAHTPFAAPLIALTAGITAGRYFESYTGILTNCAVMLLGVCLLLAPHLCRNKQQRIYLKYKVRNCIWLIVLPAFFICGNYLILNNKIATDDTNRHPYLTAVVTDRTTSTTGDILTVKAESLSTDMGSAINVPACPILIYTSATNITVGDKIHLKAPLQPVPEDSPHYLHQYAHGIDYTASVPAEHITVISHSHSIFTLAANLRDNITIFIDRTQLASPTKNFLKALLIGDKSSITTNQRADFSASGLAHILSLSGLHIGIILLIIGRLLLPLHLWGLRCLRLLLMGLVIVAYALITGMNAPVTRAVIMAVCMLTAIALERPHSAINALALAACIILICNVRALFDIGFQLSFLCTLTIITVIKNINENFKKGRKKQIITAIAVPLSATLASWPIIAYHFHTLPALFLPMNLIAVPLLPIYMLCTLIYLALAVCGISLNPLAWIIDNSYSALEQATRFISDLNVNLDNIVLHPLTVFLGVMAAICLLYAMRRHHIFSKACALTLYTAFMLAIMLYPQAEFHRHLIIPPDYSRLEIRTSTDTGTASHPLADGQMLSIHTGEISILFADRDINRYTSASIPKTDIITIGQNCQGNIKALIENTQPALVILSARLYPWQKDDINEWCKTQNIKVHQLSESEWHTVL